MSEPTIRIKVEVDERHLRESLADVLRSIADDISPRESVLNGPYEIHIDPNDAKNVAEAIAVRDLNRGTI